MYMLFIKEIFEFWIFFFKADKQQKLDTQFTLYHESNYIEIQTREKHTHKKKKPHKALWSWKTHGD